MKKVVLFGLMLLLGCALKAQTLKGTKWHLTAIYDDTHQNILSNSKIKGMLSFETDSTYSGSFCNTFMGKYNLTSNKTVLMKKPFGTMSYCAEGNFELEKKLYAYFGAANIYTLEENELSLMSDKGKLVFTKQ